MVGPWPEGELCLEGQRNFRLGEKVDDLVAANGARSVVAPFHVPARGHTCSTTLLSLALQFLF